MKVYRNKKAGALIGATYDELLKQWGTPYTEQMLVTRYGETHLISWGQQDKIPIVLFHGVGDDSALMWLYNAKMWGEHFRLYAVDTIGGPGKSIPGEGYNASFQEELWIDDILDGLKLDKVSMIGVSHGGGLVQMYAVKRPERIEKVISMAATVPVGKSNPMRTMIKIFLPEALFPISRNVNKLIRKLTGENYAVFTEHALVMEHYRWLLKGFNNMAMGNHKLWTFSEEQVKQIRPVAFYLVGKDDPFMQLGGEGVLERERMNYKVYPGVGHGINHEISGEINRTVVDILEGRVTELSGKDEL